ncbi:GNAT family N-acetyltransferase [Virgisporangium aurantiacum]|uniref:N-acetyltransferase n=1 Tax=Virgisporangium aurantiacum TaxID=175570 RepID=A0A8J3ZG75_9ACTN|nr:GNAT family N-acetyltransferase [Virgisporangium aurantiacum]GIJ63344.1 N-acetyltransferase [Virgisporangium aurantiacum]
MDISPTMTVEPARPQDMATLTTIVRTSDAYDGHYRPLAAAQTLDVAYLNTNVVRVIRGPGGDVHGFYSLLLPGMGAEGEGELDFIFVANGLKRRGVGRALFDDMRVVARELELSLVHIVVHPPAEPFYLACGARRIGEIPPTGRATWTRPYLTLVP